MIFISPSINNSPLSAYIPPEQADVYVTRSVLDQAVAAIERAGGPHAPVPASGGIELDPRLATILDTYVRDAQPGEDRATARARIETAIAQGKEAALSLKGLGLLTVPPVIPNVISLDLSDNRISELPLLPCDIQVLLVARNRLRSLPNPLPAQLVQLDVSHNYLASLTETLSDRVVHVDARDNGLLALPNRLPRELRVLHVTQNRVDLTQAAADRLAKLSARRVYDAVAGAPAATALRAAKKMSGRQCGANLDAHFVLIPPIETAA